MAGQLNINIQTKFWLKFTDWCHQAVVLGYKEMKSKSTNYKEREEEDISAVLCEEMRKLSLIKSKQISIITEVRIHSEEILSGQKKAKSADRIDFRFTKWRLETEKEYFAEAKNLSHKDWGKKAGKTVRAWNQKDYYIRTGINGLVAGKYKQLEGFLVGYIVNGSAKDNVESLNSLIRKKKLQSKIGLIESWKSINSYPNCYTSKNIKDGDEVILQHIFLEFDN